MLKTTKIAEAEFDLYKAGFGWITANNGVHLQVVAEGKVIADYWPTTKQIIFRKGTGLDLDIRATLTAVIFRK